MGTLILKDRKLENKNIYELSDYFPEPFFTTKKLVHIY